MSAITALSMANYTIMKNNALYGMMSNNNARMGLLSSPLGNVSFGSLGALSAMDTQMELESINCSVQYQMAKAMLESLKKLQKEETKKFNIFA